MRTGQLEVQPHCPTCKKLLDGFTAIDHDKKPKAGDVTICAYCNEVLQFTDDMSLKLASPGVIEECGLLEISRGQRQAREFKERVDMRRMIKESIGST